MRSRNTDIRAIPVDFANPDASDSFSASNKTFFDRLDALESSSLPLDGYASVVCPEMSGNYLWSRTWGGVSGNVRKCPEIRAVPYARQNPLKYFLHGQITPSGALRIGFG